MRSRSFESEIDMTVVFLLLVVGSRYSHMRMEGDAVSKCGSLPPTNHCCHMVFLL